MIIVLVEFVGGLQRFDGLFPATGGLERQTEVEMPLGTIRVQRQSVSERLFGLVPASGFVELVGPFDMAFSF